MQTCSGWFQNFRAKTMSTCQRLEYWLAEICLCPPLFLPNQICSMLRLLEVSARYVTSILIYMFYFFLKKVVQHLLAYVCSSLSLLKLNYPPLIFKVFLDTWHVPFNFLCFQPNDSQPSYFAFTCLIWIMVRKRSCGFRHIFTLGFLLFLTPAGCSNPAGQS